MPFSIGLAVRWRNWPVAELDSELASHRLALTHPEGRSGNWPPRWMISATESGMEQASEVKRGTDESAAWFRQKLVELGITQSDLARLLVAYGDDRPFDTILRGFRRMAAGDARVSGEMRAWLNHLADQRSKNLEHAESLDQRVEMYRNRRMTLLMNGVDNTEWALADAERQRQQLRELPVPFRA